MINPNCVTVKMSFQSVPVEIEIAGQDENGVGPQDVINVIEEYKKAGFIAPVSWTAQKRDTVIGKRATLTKGPVFLADKKMWQYSIQPDGMDKPFEWNDFSRTAFRVGDLIEIGKNERGFMVGQVVDPNNPLPGMGDKPADNHDDIPF